MDKLNARIGNFVTDNRMPAAMAVVALATFTHVNGRLDLKPYAISVISRFVDEVWIALVMVMFVGTIRIHCVGKNIGYQPAKIIALDKISKRSPYLKQHISVDQVENGLGLVERCLKLMQR